MVASRKRADGVLGYLRDRGTSEEALGRVHAPSGIDLGAIDHEEIAVAILAELVRERAAGNLEAAPLAELPPHEEVDPVCGMMVDVATARYRSVYEGTTYYFCSVGCVERFELNPAPFLAAKA